MRPPYITDEFLQGFIAAALHEDVGDCDHSSNACISPHSSSVAKLKIKDAGILAGTSLAKLIFAQLDPDLRVTECLNDGTAIAPGDIGFIVSGNTRSILMAERLVLNCLQRMSGIATKASHLCQLIQGTQAVLLDTRKTTPNFRLIEKWAVTIGGAHNHRLGLFDMIMLKDNHIEAAGGIQAAILRTKDYLRTLGKTLKIEVETRSLKEVEQVLAEGNVDVIMLDNMSLADMRTAVQMIGGRYKTEASGGIDEKNIRDVALCGVDYISLGALTHSVRSLDMSLKIVGK